MIILYRAATVDEILEITLVNKYWELYESMYTV
jgi:hypothetical protein